MKETDVEYKGLLKELVCINENLSAKSGQEGFVSGWMNHCTKKRPYDGKGTLISYVFSNKRSGEVLYYACSDEQVISLFTIMYRHLESEEKSMRKELYIKGLDELCKNQGISERDTVDWDVNFRMKGNYDVYALNQIEDLNHLNTMNGFTLENFELDFQDFSKRNINLAQFIVEQCILLISKEIN